MHDIFKEIWTTITHNRLRTALTGFSVAWGIFILIPDFVIVSPKNLRQRV